MLRRTIDILAASVGLIILCPGLALVALLIKLDSHGSVFFRGQRVGKDGVIFRIVKFRTMIEHSSQAGPAVTCSDDPRVTRVGKFLRRTKIDEIAQLWNVICGDMTLVGPRPEDPRYVALYDDCQRQILKVRPGITSPASMVFRNEEALLPAGHPETYTARVMPEKIRIDLEYLRNRTWLTDMRVLIQTLSRIFRAHSPESPFR